MKSITLIATTVIITYALTAFTYTSWNSIPTHKISCQTTIEIEPPSFFYNLSPLANNTITKERMHNATTVSDLIPDNKNKENLENNIIYLRDVKISIEKEKAGCTNLRFEKKYGNNLNKEQMYLLKSIDYSTNFSLEGYYTDNNLISGLNNDRYFNYFMTVVPEQQASYKGGRRSFLDFLTTNCQATINKVQRGNLKSGNISFTITKAGTISNIRLKSTCGYSSVDARMLELMNNLQDGWNAATNMQGEKVNQTLVFSYGQTGC